MFIRTRFLCAISVSVLLLTTLDLSGHAAPPVGKSKLAPAAIKVEAPTPESALRTFLIALISQDVKALRRTTLPLDEEDFAYLTNTPPVQAGVLIDAQKQLRTVPIRLLKAGQSVEAANGKTLTIMPGSVGAHRALLMTEAFPGLVTLEKVNGQWRVNAVSIVAALKRAETMRRQRLNRWPLIAAQEPVR